MTRTIDNSRLTEAWLLAWQSRCCPPDAVLAGAISEELKRHLESCPFCRTERTTSMPRLRLNPASVDKGEKLRPQSGELWSVQPSCGGWGPKDRYYNPPVVLVTGVAQPDHVQVIQTSGAVELAGPDDLFLGNGLSGFAEPWNRYTLRIGDLSTCLGRISRQQLDKLRKHTHATPSSPEPGSLLWFFRQMEVESGWFFAGQALGCWLDQPENISLGGILDTPVAELAADLQQLPVIVPDMDISCSAADFLAHTMPADDLLPLAAAELQPQTIQILLFIVDQGKIQTSEMIPAHLTLTERKESFLHVSGCCRSDLPDDAVWVFRWQSDSWSVQPLPGQYGAREGVFWAVFPMAETTAPEEGELIVRILVQR